MLQTQLELTELQAQIPHLAAVDETGWTLQWGESAGPRFEIVCTQAQAQDVQVLESRLNQAYEKALRFFSEN